MVRLYIRDNAGQLWFFEDGLIQIKSDYYIPQNGYPVASLEEGIRLLNEEGYIGEEPDL